MGYVVLPTRTSNDMNSAADINQLMENIEYVKALEESDISNIKNLNGVAQATYSPYYVQSSTPSSPAHGYLWYDTDDNKLYKYNAKTESWVEIDWATAVQATPEWQAGKLRISNGNLQITPNSGTNWYNCYPAIGSNVIEIKSYDNDNYTYIYFTIAGTTLIARNCYHIPIAFAQEIRQSFSFAVQLTSNTANNYWLGIRPSNIALSNVYAIHIRGGGSGITQNNTSSLTMLAIVYTSLDSGIEVCGNIDVTNNRIM